VGLKLQEVSEVFLMAREAREAKAIGEWEVLEVPGLSTEAAAVAAGTSVAAEAVPTKTLAAPTPAAAAAVPLTQTLLL
jgi:hypothetical protein